jgi:hypothetical protein
LSTLAETLGRTLVITIASGAATAMILDRVVGVVDGPFLSLLLGSGVYGLTALIGVRWIGDAPLREGMGRILEKLRPPRTPPAGTP